MSKRKRRPEAVAGECREALLRVERALENHRAGRPEGLSASVLEQVSVELRAMLNALDKSMYSPNYAIYILDWPNDHGLVNYLVGVACNYERWT